MTIRTAITNIQKQYNEAIHHHHNHEKLFKKDGLKMK